MSIFRWAYKPEKCEGDFCPGDCDYCRKAEEDICQTCLRGSEGYCFMYEKYTEKTHCDLYIRGE